MKDWYEAAAVIEKLGITGILAGVIVILLSVVKKLWAQIQEQQQKLLRLAQGKEID